MATTAFTSWYEDVLPYVPGCPEPVALQKIRQAAIDYCRQSRAWRYLSLGPIDPVASQQTYVIGTSAALGSLPADVVVVHVYQVNYDGTPLEFVTPAAFRAKDDLWFSEVGTPEVVTSFEEGELSFYPIPESTGVDLIKCPEIALAPTQAAAGVDERIYQFARETIAKGARALILQIPKKPYSDPMLGMELWQQFELEAGGADLRASSGRGHARIRTRTISR